MGDETTANPQVRPVKVFCAYSHKDEVLRNELEAHVSILKRRGIVSVWHDRRITPGADWANNISEHLNGADIILLLVSSDFIASNYCYETEMRRAMERHELRETRVIPVMLRPCDWDGAPFFKLQGLPTDMRPVTRWINQDEAFTDIAVGIRKVAEELQAAPSKSPRESNRPSSAPQGSTPDARLLRSPRRDPFSLQQWGPRLEVEVGVPILPRSGADVSAGTGSPSNGMFSRMPALIDTGAAITVLTPRVISTLGLPQIDVTRVARAGGTDNVGVYAAAFRFPRYKLPTIKIAKVICCELPYQPLQCLLGRDILFHWQFSYDGPTGEWTIEVKDR